MFGDARRANPDNPQAGPTFDGPWELFEVLEDEFRQIDEGFARRTDCPWRVVDGDILDRELTRQRLLDFKLAGYEESAAHHGDTDVKIEYSIGGVGGATRDHTDDKPTDPPTATLEQSLNEALTMAPSDLVDRVRSRLVGDRGRALSQNIPIVGTGPDPNPLRAQFNRQVIDLAFSGLIVPAPDRALRELFARVSPPKGASAVRGRRALALSGGGVRSAAFSLGVVQELARQNALGKMDYLSTVSGGGYVGSWLSAWMSRVGRTRVLVDLGSAGSPGQSGEATDPIEPEPPPVHHLRSFASYLSPRRGLMSADVWTLAATYIRNLLLNWLVVLPLLAAVLLLPVWSAAIVAHPPAGSALWVWLVGLVAAGSLAGASAVYFVHSRRPQRLDQPTTKLRSDVEASKTLDNSPGQRAFIEKCLLPIVLAAVAFNTSWIWWEAARPEIGTMWPRWIQWFFDRDHEYAVPLAVGIVVHTAGWILAVSPRGAVRKWGEGVAVFVTGGAAGLVFYASFLGVEAASDLMGARWWKAIAGLTHVIDALPADVFLSLLAFPAVVLSVVLAGFLFIGLTSSVGVTTDTDREWSARYSAWLLMSAVAWLVGAAVVLLSGFVLAEAQVKLSVGAAVASGWITAQLGKSEKTQAAATTATTTSGATALLWRLALAIAAPVAIALVLMSIASVDAKLIGVVRRWLATAGAPHFDVVPLVLAIGLALAVFSVACSLFFDTNKFSLHAMYQARLSRAYLGASRRAGTRHPDPFTQFDQSDDLEIGHLCAQQKREERPPIHVLNLALNLTKGTNLAWQDRKARSFTVTPFFAGSLGVGYRRTSPNENAGGTSFYGGAPENTAITLGTAMAISGAAASPAMGYHSSPSVTFLMALFNARLGWWLGNPGWAGQTTFSQSNPPSKLPKIVDEMLGLTTDSDALVYLSDGGHFENIGLYEMVSRRCATIVVVDASCDEHATFGDLGNAIRKIRIDLGVPISFDAHEFKLFARGADGAPNTNGRHFAIGEIHYDAVAPRAANGLLVYVKPALNGDEPRDVLAYADECPTFPHESTADQFFGEAQFESYRALGQHSMSDALATVRGNAKYDLMVFG